MATRQSGGAGWWIAGGLAWLAGVAAQLMRPDVGWGGVTLAEARLQGLVAALFGVGLLAGRVWRREAWRGAGVVLVAAAAAAGWGVATWQAAARLADVLPPPVEGRDLELTGVVASLPRIAPDGARFAFEVEHATHDGQPVAVPRRVWLAWTRGWQDDALLAGPPADVRAGQRWRFTARLRAPVAAVNPHLPDGELWLFEQGFRATGSVRATAARPPQRLAEGAGHRIDRWRQDVRDALARAVPDARAAGVLAALAVGDQDAIDRDDWAVFRDSGTAHLMAISGLHITMFAWAGSLVAGRLWRLHPALMLAVPARTAGRGIGLALAVAYALLAGWGVPAQRTVWMLAAATTLDTLGLRWPWPLVLLSAAVVVSALDPWALLQPGFWLSFAAVGLLMASEPAGRRGDAGQHGVEHLVEHDGVASPRTAPMHRLGAIVAGAVRTQLVATVALAPLTLVLFQQLSLVGLLANLLAIPLVTLLVTPLALAGTLASPLALPAWTAAAAVVDLLGDALAGLAAWPGAVWWAPAAAFWARLAALAGGVLLVLPLPWRMRLLGLPMVLPLLLPAPDRPADGRFELLAPDIGQGTAVIVRTHRHLLLVDAGPAWGPRSDAGNRVLVPLLRALGERRVDQLLLSHRDLDHVGGAASLMDALPVAELRSSLEPGHPLRRREAPHVGCVAGQRWSWDGVQFELLHPDDGTLAAGHAGALRPNALSCVLRVQADDGTSVLFTGDLEAPQEAGLLERAGPAKLRSTLLWAPHHGSVTSSTPGFLEAVAPQLAVVQAGYRNRYGHPAAAVEARYAALGIEVVRSDRCGAWRRRDDGTMSCERHVQRRYWRALPGPCVVAVTPMGAGCAVQRR